MRRRSFLAAAVGASLLRDASLLRAATAQPGLIERRTYSGCTPEFRDTLERCLREAGIDAQRQPASDPTYICRFASIASRNAAWDRVSTLPSWPAAARGFRRYRFELHS